MAVRGLDFRGFGPCPESSSRELVSLCFRLVLGQNRSGGLFGCPELDFRGSGSLAHVSWAAPEQERVLQHILRFRMCICTFLYIYWPGRLWRRCLVLGHCSAAYFVLNGKLSMLLRQDLDLHTFYVLNGGLGVFLIGASELER